MVDWIALLVWDRHDDVMNSMSAMRWDFFCTLEWVRYVSLGLCVPGWLHGHDGYRARHTLASFF